MKKIDHTGRRFGRLIAIQLMARRGKSSNDTVYLCKCDCGKEKQIRYSNLMSGGTLSCGCLQKELLSARALPPLELAINTKFNDYKNGARTRGYGWCLSKNEFTSLIIQKCHYCGAEPNPLNGVDRFDNYQSYVLANCVSCCYICNRAKSTLTTQEFEEWIINIYGNLFEGDS